jgi:hypothetical protein
VRTDFRRGEDQAGVDIGDAAAGVAHTSQGFAEKDGGIRVFPFGIGRREERADIGGGDGAEQGVSDGMQQDVAIGMAAQALVMRQGDPADLQRDSGTELVRVKAVADSGRRFRVSSFGFQVV